ncbi:PAS domain S-box protein [Tumebacillus sp. DT12]|uniref:PAS domain S-box protein n=1 Tax=Tumebacillus lacus TaxID=2995335 RepID=A0ABT3X762_9BACL|nr:PAS domain S-box protein [Tumebacillus lacus]MCX7571476.1 PAS domain S-box protein [Tumebacillus lacus]
MVSSTQDVLQLEGELRSTRQLLEAFVNNAAVAFLVCDLDGRVLRTNRTFEQAFGWREEQVLGEVLPVVPMEARVAYLDALRESGYQLTAAEQERQRQDGSTFVASETVVPMPGTEGGMSGFALIMRDISSRKAEERRLKESEMRYRSLFEHNPDGVFMIDLNGVFTSINPAAEHITGYTENELIGRSYEFFTESEEIERLRELFQRALQGATQNYEMAIRHKQGQRVELSVISLPIEIDGELIGVYGIAKDITEAKRAERMINHMAYHDALTDLPNRRLFENKLIDTLAGAQQRGERAAVLFLDLDRFKSINDTQGHAAGDGVLVTVADRLRECVRDTDVVARISGDEFTLILPDIKKGTAETVAQRVLDSLRRPIFIGVQDYHVTASIGISIYPDHGGDAAALMKRADAAMYRSKGLGKNTWQMYQPSFETLLKRQNC